MQDVFLNYWCFDDMHSTLQMTASSTAILTLPSRPFVPVRAVLKANICAYEVKEMCFMIPIDMPLFTPQTAIGGFMICQEH